MQRATDVPYSSRRHHRTLSKDFGSLYWIELFDVFPLSLRVVMGLLIKIHFNHRWSLLFWVTLSFYFWNVEKKKFLFYRVVNFYKVKNFSFQISFAKMTLKTCNPFKKFICIQNFKFSKWIFEQIIIILSNAFSK